MTKLNNEIIQIDDIQNWLENKKLPKISADTGIAYLTLYHIKKGKSNCRWSTLLILSKYIREDINKNNNLINI